MSRKTFLVSSALTMLALASFVSPALAKSSGKTTGTATSTVATSAQIACVGKAVAARESAFDSGSTAYQSSVSSAYTIRAKSLASAYATGTSAGVVAGIKTAWSTFDTATTADSAAWAAKRLAIWASFKIAAAACKAPSGVVDSSI